jgi:hypothetical protein
MPFQFEQLALDLFPNARFDDLIAREQYRDVSVSVSRRLKRGWYAKCQRGLAHRHLVIPPYLENAPEFIKRKLLEWALLARPKRKSEIGLWTAQRREYEEEILKYIDSLDLHKAQTNNTVNPERYELRTAGCKFDLKEVFAYLNALYFEGKLTSRVRWGRCGSTTSYQSAKFDKNGTRFSLITIAGVYDYPSVPEYALHGVMYHEMLHLAYPPVKLNGRRIIHSREFKTAERQFKYFQEWRTWERGSVRRIARLLRRKH